jgi:uncharacterized protein YndB with AHSA1/START domain
MIKNTTLKITTPSEREISWTREFKASKKLVFDAITKPELIRRWLLGPEGWTMPVCEIDLRVGGKYRYVWSHPEKGEMGMGGVYKEIIKHEKIVSTEVFDEAWYAYEAIGTVLLIEKNGITTVLTTMLYENKEVRDGVLKSNMETGLTASYNRLSEVLVELVKAHE